MSKKIWIASFIFVVIAGGVTFKLWSSQKGKDDVRYQQVKVGRDNLEMTILSTGIVGPENRVEIKPPVAGRVEKVLVEEGNNVRKGQVLAWMSSTERAAMLDAASAQGREEVKKWEEMYRPTPILAPIAGSIIQRNVESGQTFTISDAVLVMSDRLTVKAQVDETDISQIKNKQKATIILDAYPTQKIIGTVDKIAFDAKTVNNVTTYIVDVLPSETPPYMRSGMTANVTFDVNSKQNILLVSTDAIKIKDGRSIVLVQGENVNDPIERQIEVGASDGKRTEVVAGLSEGEVIFVPEFRPNKKGKGGPTSPFSPMGRRGH